MAINYAEKYSDVIDERFTQGALTTTILNDQYEFDGVNKITVYSTDTVPLNDYDMNATTNRYGTPTELGNDVQALKLTQDKSFTFTIDRRNRDDTMMANSAGLALNRQIDEVVIPTIDKYRINALAQNAGSVEVQTITKENAYECFLDASAMLVDKKIPVNGRTAFVTPAYYKNIKLDKRFTSYGDQAQQLAKSGAVGFIDNTEIILAPTDYFPENVNYIVTCATALVSPIKLSEYLQHENPVGISGWVCEGRIYYDAFVLKNKKNAVFVSVNSNYTTE